MNEDFRMEQGYKEAAYGDSLGRYTAKTFGWMFIGLLITFGVTIGMYMTDGLYYVSRVPGWYYILFIAEITSGNKDDQPDDSMARTMFFLYAAVNGIVFSVYFLVFDARTFTWHLPSPHECYGADRHLEISLSQLVHL